MGGGSSVANTHACDQCSCDKLSQNDDVSFCVECVQYLCQKCSSEHERNNLTRNHRVLHGQDLPEDTTKFKQIKELTKCAEHPNNDISAICGDHDKLICLLCMTKTHRKCERIEAIDDHLDIPIAETELLAVTKEVETNIAKVKKEKSKLDHEQNSAVKTVEDFSNAIKERVDKRTRDILQEIETLSRPEICKLTRAISCCENLQSTANYNKTLLQIANLYGSHIEKFIIQKHVSDSINKVRNEMGEIAGRDPAHVQYSELLKKSKLNISDAARVEEIPLRSSSLQLELSSDEYAVIDSMETLEEMTKKKPEEPTMVNKYTQVQHLHTFPKKTKR